MEFDPSDYDPEEWPEAPGILGDFSRKFWMIACHTDLEKYVKNSGSDSPPRVKLYNKEEAIRVAHDMSARYRNRFYVLEAIEVTGEFTTKEFKEAKAKKEQEELDDFLK